MTEKGIRGWVVAGLISSFIFIQTVKANDPPNCPPIDPCPSPCPCPPIDPNPGEPLPDPGGPGIVMS